VQARSLTCDRSGLDWARLDDPATRRTVQLERELALLLGGGCERPVGVHVNLQAGRIHASWAPDTQSPARVATIDAVALELATIVSVREPGDVDDAAAWTAGQLAPQLAELLGAPLVEVAR
jgi:porphobilinogen deaminase